MTDMFEKYNAWRKDQLEKGEARYARLKAKSAELDRAIAARKATAPPKPRKQASGKFTGVDGTLAFARGELSYRGRGRKTVPVRDVVSVSVEDGAEFSRRATLGRTGGGALAGAVVFGPVGALVGAGLGATAKKESGGEKYLAIETATEAFVVEVPRAEIGAARVFASSLLAEAAAEVAA